MAIVTSAIVEDAAQADGRRSVRERHTDHLGGVYEIAYLAESGVNVEAAMAGRVGQIEASLKAGELDTNTADPFVARYRFSTEDELGEKLHAEYVAGERQGLLAQWFLASSDAQLRSWFGVTQREVGPLRTSLAEQAGE